MIENKLSFFFKGQIWHLGGTIILFYIGAQFVDLKSNTNTLVGISALGWFMFAMLIPLIHQAYVWICWRSELCWKSISSTIGFKGYVILFCKKLNIKKFKIISHKLLFVTSNVILIIEKE